MIGWLIVAVIAVVFIAVAVFYFQWRDRKEREAFAATLTSFERQRLKTYSDWRDYIPLVTAEREKSIVSRIYAERDARARREAEA